MTFTATAAYPYVNADRATAGLRAQLREHASNAMRAGSSPTSALSGHHVWHHAFRITGPAWHSADLGLSS